MIKYLVGGLIIAMMVVAVLGIIVANTSNDNAIVVKNFDENGRVFTCDVVNDTVKNCVYEDGSVVWWLPALRGG